MERKYKIQIIIAEKCEHMPLNPSKLERHEVTINHVSTRPVKSNFLSFGHGLKLVA